MTTDAILGKLTAELNRGVTSEVQVVYLLAGIRKIIERDQIGERYPQLMFHCHWALHSRLSGPAAQAILMSFDAAHPRLRGKVKLHQLPRALRTEIDRISQMKSFEEELVGFLAAYGLPPLTLHRSDGWAHFLHLYAKVVEDIPLVVTLPGLPKQKRKRVTRGSAPNHISRVTVHCDVASETVKSANRQEVVFRLRWTIQDRSGESGELSIFNSFEMGCNDILE